MVNNVSDPSVMADINLEALMMMIIGKQDAEMSFYVVSISFIRY